MRVSASHPEGVEAIWLETWRSRTARLGFLVYRAGPFLIDSGPRHARRLLFGWPGLDGARICLLTHHDEDHVGNAAALARHGLTVQATRPVIEALRHCEPIPLYRRWVWGTAEPAKVTELAGTAAAGGWELRPLHTPGHCADHHVFHEPNRDLVFSADLYIGRRVPVARRREDVVQLLESLRRVRDLRPKTLFCAHRGRVDDAVEALNAKIAWLEELVERVRGLVGRGLGVRQITRRVLGREGPVYWVSRGEYCKRNLVAAAIRALAGSSVDAASGRPQ